MQCLELSLVELELLTATLRTRLEHMRHAALYEYIPAVQQLYNKTLAALRDEERLVRIGAVSAASAVNVGIKANVAVSGGK